MSENDDLQILIEAALDFEKSLTTMTAQMNQLREKLKGYQIKITAGLNQTASAAQIKADLKKINTAKTMSVWSAKWIRRRQKRMLPVP